MLTKRYHTYEGVALATVEKGRAVGPMSCLMRWTVAETSFKIKSLLKGGDGILAPVGEPAFRIWSSCLGPKVAQFSFQVFSG